MFLGTVNKYMNGNWKWESIVGMVWPPGKVLQVNPVC